MQLYFVKPPDWQVYIFEDTDDPSYWAGMTQTPPWPGQYWTWNPTTLEWDAPVTSYIVELASGSIIDKQTPVYNIPSGTAAITVAPPDERMTWNFVSEAWEWSIYALKKVAFNMQSTKVKEDFVWNTRTVTPGCPAMKFNVYAAAIAEDPDDHRTVYFKSDFNPTEDYVILTNAQIIDLFDTYWGMVGKVNNIFADIIDDITNLVIEDGDEVATAWTYYDENYDDERTILPTLAELAEAIENFTIPGIADIVGLQAALDAKSTFSGSYTDLSNKPTAVSAFTNDVGYVTNTFMATTLADYAQTAGVVAALAGKETAGAAATVQAFAIQRANHTGTQAASTITGLHAVATTGNYNDLTNRPTIFSGAYNDLSGKPTLFSGNFNDLSNKPVIGKAIVGTTAKTSSFYVTKSATVASGVAVFHFTDDGLSTGNPLFTEVDFDTVNPIVNDNSSSYQYGWAWSNSNKTLTVTVSKFTTANLLSGILGQTAANGAVVRVTVFGR